MLNNDVQPWKKIVARLLWIGSVSTLLKTISSPNAPKTLLAIEIAAGLTGIVLYLSWKKQANR